MMERSGVEREGGFKKGRPPVVCIVGRKNAGKTQLTVVLASELNRRGWRVMTAKHGHGFHLDQPGRDSWRHRHEGGARRTVLAGPGEFGVVGAWPRAEMSLGELVDRFLSDADIVLAEGFKKARESKIEVFRAEGGSEPFVTGGEPWARKIVALVTDATDLDVPVPVFSPTAPDHARELADFVCHRFLEGDRDEGP